MPISSGKWSQYKIMKKDPLLSDYLPETLLFSERNLWHLIDKFNKVIIKPCNRGHSLISVSCIAENHYEIDSGNEKEIIAGKEQIYKYLCEKYLTQKHYIVQQRIELATIEGMPFDFKVIIKKEEKSWRVTGILGRVAAEGLIITDLNKAILPFEEVIKKSSLAEMRLLYEIDYIAMLTAGTMEEYYPECEMTVLDLGVDQKETLWIIDVALQFPTGKWNEYQVMKGDLRISPYLPETNFFSESSLWEFIDKYKQVIIKPCWGQWGRFVIQITFLGNEQYELHSESSKLILKGKKQTYDYLKNIYLTKIKNLFIVQQRIPLMTYDNCPFDLRIMVQRKRSSPDWDVTGGLARVASDGFIVTNVTKYILPIEKAIQNNCINQFTIKDKLSEIYRVALLTAIQLEKFYSRSLCIGFDMGLDDKGNIWIIEANFKPDIQLFYCLEDKTMYKTIQMYLRD
jgi:hypothetical protein